MSTLAVKLDRARARKLELERDIRVSFRFERAIRRAMDAERNPRTLGKLQVDREQTIARRRNLSKELRKTKEILACR